MTDADFAECANLLEASLKSGDVSGQNDDNFFALQMEADAATAAQAQEIRQSAILAEATKRGNALVDGIVKDSKDPNYKGISNNNGLLEGDQLVFFRAAVITMLTRMLSHDWDAALPSLPEFSAALHEAQTNYWNEVENGVKGGQIDCAMATRLRTWFPYFFEMTWPRWRDPLTLSFPAVDPQNIIG